MTCAKRTVVCVIIDKAGLVSSGSNMCSIPQSTCPREEGEGYEKCTSICDQACHAEIDALGLARLMNRNLTGATAYICGHDHVCEDCEKALAEAGVAEVKVVGSE